MSARFPLPDPPWREVTQLKLGDVLRQVLAASRRVSLHGSELIAQSIVVAPSDEVTQGISFVSTISAGGIVMVASY